MSCIARLMCYIKQQTKKSISCQKYDPTLDYKKNAWHFFDLYIVASHLNRKKGAMINCPKRDASVLLLWETFDELLKKYFPTTKEFKVLKDTIPAPFKEVVSLSE